MKREKNPCGKIRTKDAPYEIWQNPNKTWTWLVLKKYQHPGNEKKNPMARWYVAVQSPMTFGSFEYGDAYAHDIFQCARKLTEDQMTHFLNS